VITVIGLATLATVIGDIEEFVTGHRDEASIDTERVLATVLFTDIVGSTQSAVKMGDQTWRQLLESHDQIAKQMVERHRGVLVKTTGDGILATFDGPGRAVRLRVVFRRGFKANWSALASRVAQPVR